MPRRSRGNGLSQALQSQSTPDLTRIRSLDTPENVFSRQEPHSTKTPRPAGQRASPEEHNATDDVALDVIEDPSSMVGESEDSESEASDGELQAPRPLRTSRSHSNLPRHNPSMLFPPFYNRPPNPLPPSPSLTSLLRPTFSATTSRPTTPESSDIELPGGSGRATSGGTSRASSVTTTSNLASITKSARHAPTVPRASPKVPTYEYYGFAVYLGSSAAFLMYILWAYLPSPLLHQMGIHYYPNRWWALAVPCWLVVLVIYIYVALASYNTKYLTLPLSSCENLVDECAQVAIVDRRTGKIVREAEMGKVKGLAKERERGKGGKGSAGHGRRDSYSAYQFSAAEEPEWKGFWSTGTDAVMDVPIGGVCEILYGGE